MTLTKEQKDLRTKGVGGSDIHHLFSLPPYGCARKLWYDQKEQVPDYPFYGNFATERGSKLEDLVVKEYQEKTGNIVSKDKTFFTHPAYPILIGNIDATLVKIESKRGIGVLECKCPGLQMFKKIKREGLPESYILQMQHYLLVTGRKFGDFAILNAELWDLIWFEVLEDKDIQEKIKNECVSFWGLVEGEAGPERLKASDKRCISCPYRTSCQGEELLKALKIPEAKENEIVTDTTMSSLIDEYKELSEIVSEASEELEKVKAEIKEKMEKTLVVDTGNARVYYRPEESKRLNSKKLKAEKPEIYEEYLSKSISRPLRVFPKI